MYSSENYLMFKNDVIMSPALNCQYDDTDTSEYFDEDINSSGTDSRIDNVTNRSSSIRLVQPKRRNNLSEMRFTSPVSSPLFSAPYRGRTDTSPTERSPSKVLSLFDATDVSYIQLNITLEFNSQQDLVYISPCVYQLLGYDSTELIESNSTLFTQLPALPVNVSTLIYTTKLDPTSRIKQSHHSRDIYVVANALLRVGEIKSIVILYKAVDATGKTLNMEGQGMLLEQHGKVSMIWVTRIVENEPVTTPAESGMSMSRRSSSKKMSADLTSLNMKSSIGNEAGWGKDTVDILNDLGLCHICERSIPVTLFEGHTKVCSAVHHAGI